MTKAELEKLFTDEIIPQTAKGLKKLKELILKEFYHTDSSTFEYIGDYLINLCEDDYISHKAVERVVIYEDVKLLSYIYDRFIVYSILNNSIKKRSSEYMINEVYKLWHDLESYCIE